MKQYPMIALFILLRLCSSTMLFSQGTGNNEIVFRNSAPGAILIALDPEGVVFNNELNRRPSVAGFSDPNELHHLNGGNIGTFMGSFMIPAFAAVGFDSPWQGDAWRNADDVTAVGMVGFGAYRISIACALSFTMNTIDGNWYNGDDNEVKKFLFEWDGVKLVLTVLKRGKPIADPIIVQNEEEFRTWDFGTEGRNTIGYTSSSGTFLFDNPATIASQTPGWVWVHPLPQGNTLRDMQLVAPDLLVAVGYCATLMTSSDGGAHWNVRNNIGDSQADLHGIAFLDRSTAVAVGELGTVLKTTDGGGSWRKISFPMSIMLFGVRFPSRNAGFIAGEGVLMRSTDEGETWTKMDANAGAALYDVEFSDPLHGGAVGDASIVHRTTDGGATWSDQIAPGARRILGLEFADENFGLALSAYGGVFRTTDGGARWDSLTPAWDNPLFRVHRFSPDEFAAVGGQAAGEQLTGDATTVHSSDGGMTWSRTTHEGFTLLGMASSADTVWAVGGLGTMIKTIDRGKNWNTIGNTSGEFFTAGKFLDADNGWIASARRRILRTTDGGESWREALLEDRTAGVDFFDVYDENNLRYFGQYRYAPFNIVRTTDGGKTWTSEFTGWEVKYHALRYVTLQTSFLIGDLGTIFKTSNNGTTWLKKETGRMNTLRELSFVGTQIGYVVGDSGIVLKTIDGGETWNACPTGTLASLRSVRFFDALNGCAVGDAFLRTTDGGATWTITSCPKNIDGAVIIDQNTAYAYGGRGIIQKTTDAGVSWQNQWSGTRSVIRLFFRDALNGFAIGENGVILKTTTGGLVTVREKPQPVPASAFLDQNYPNPFSRSTTLAFRLPSETKIELLLYDALGRLVRRVAGGAYAPGAHEVRIDAGALLPGLYFCRLLAGREAMVRKMVVVR